MERPENSETARQQSPPTLRSEASSSDRPWHNRVPPPPLPSLPPDLAGGVDLRVSKGLLWVGGAAYPLRNITRVYTFQLTPRRGEVTVLFLKRVGIVLSMAFALTVLNGITGLASYEDTSQTITQFVWFGAVVALVCCVWDWVVVLTADSHWVLAVETSGASTALVTSENTQHLNELVGHVVNSIENPESELQVKVETLLINPRNYHFGDNVNMYGGSGNVGKAKS